MCAKIEVSEKSKTNITNEMGLPHTNKEHHKKWRNWVAPCSRHHPALPRLLKSKSDENTLSHWCHSRTRWRQCTAGHQARAHAINVIPFQDVNSWEVYWSAQLSKKVLANPSCSQTALRFKDYLLFNPAKLCSLQPSSVQTLWDNG